VCPEGSAAAGPHGGRFRWIGGSTRLDPTYSRITPQQMRVGWRQFFKHKRRIVQYSFHQRRRVSSKRRLRPADPRNVGISMVVRSLCRAADVARASEHPRVSLLRRRFVLATRRPSASLRSTRCSRHPGRRSSAATALSTGQALKDENGFLNLCALLTHFSEHFQDVHAGSIAQPALVNRHVKDAEQETGEILGGIAADLNR
jgi:hypothetical protein